MSERHRSEEAARRLPSRVNPLLAVERPFARGAFAPAFRAVAVFDAHEHDAPLDCAPEARLEKVYEAQAYLAKLYRCDVHASKDSEVRMMRGLYSEVTFNSKVSDGTPSLVAL